VRERSLKSMALGLSGALWLCIGLSGDPAVRSVRAHAAQAPQPAELRGEHQLSAMLGPRGAWLTLKDGFSLRARPPQPGRAQAAPVRVALAVAAVRAQAAEIAQSFVPIGPSVRAAGAGLRAELAYRADAFRVRQGHRLVLALETRAPCATGEACWELQEAQYVGNRCLASGVALRGLRLQFGSIPLNASVHGRSAAP
jgi:hypothetical protein